MASKQTMKYGVVGAALALAVIAVAIVANPYLSSTTGTKSSAATGSKAGNFLILLTDPPNVPKGTTQLNVTYSGLSLQVKYANGSSASVPVTASGTINLLSLVNVSQTIGSANVPAGSTVTSIKFTITSVSAQISGKTYPVTIPSAQLVVPIEGNQVLSQTLSAALLDLSPTLVQIAATNSTGGAINYYVLIPSATAIIKSNVSQGQENVGTKTQLEQADENELEHAQQAGLGNVTITSATLSTSGNKTTFSVTLTNHGTKNATIFGLMLHGNFSVTASPSRMCSNTTSSKSSSSTTTTTTTSTKTTTKGHGNEGNPPGQNEQGENEKGCNISHGEENHPDTIPFKVNGTALVPLFGDSSDHEEAGAAASVTLKPGQSITLTFSGVIGLKTDSEEHGHTIIIGAIPSDNYAIKLEGEGFQTAQVTAT